MVQIFARYEPSQEDWFIMELQGLLESNQSSSFNGLPIGDLHFDVKGQPSLIIGHHLLSGRVMSLEKPFAVLKKTKFTDDGFIEESRTEYVVEALVRKKIIFKTRPKPIIIKNETKK